jgi:hypothetical protein
MGDVSARSCVIDLHYLADLLGSRMAGSSAAVWWRGPEPEPGAWCRLAANARLIRLPGLSLLALLLGSG